LEHDRTRRAEKAVPQDKGGTREFRQNSLSTNSIATSYLANRIIPMYQPIV